MRQGFKDYQLQSNIRTRNAFHDSIFEKHLDENYVCYLFLEHNLFVCFLQAASLKLVFYGASYLIKIQDIWFQALESHATEVL